VESMLAVDQNVKSSYIDIPSAPGPIGKIAAAELPDRRRIALSDAIDLLRSNPSQPAIARRVILIRAEVGDPNPLAALPPKRKGGPAGPSPLDAFTPPQGYPANLSEQIIAERELWRAMFQPPAAALPPQLRQRLQAMVVGMPGNASVKEAASQAFGLQNGPVPQMRPELTAEINAIPNLKWWKYVALRQLDLRTGDPAGAASELAQAKADATKSVIFTGLLSIAALAAALAGFVAIILLLVRRLSNQSDRPSIFSETPATIRDEDRRLGAGDLMNVFVLYLSLMLLTSLFAPALLHGEIQRNEGSMAKLITFEVVAESILILVCGGLTLAVLVALARRRGADLAKEIGLTLAAQPLMRVLAFGLLGWCIALPCVIAIGAVTKIIFHSAPSPSNPAIPLLISAPGGWVSVLLYILVAVFAPFFEETMFRGIFFNAARLRLGVPGGIVMTGLAFGLSHSVGIAQQIPLAVLGGVFAWMAQTRKSLAPSMFAHCLQNSFVYATLLFMMMTVT
jgi:membrane protease YdiL (CAAX protease family)